MEPTDIKDAILEIDPLCNIHFDYLFNLLQREEIDVKDLLINWKHHIEWWEREYGTKDPKYLSKNDRAERKDPIEFIESEYYKRQWDVQKVYPRDAYLFPQLKTETLYDYIRAIKEKIQQERDLRRGQASS